MTPVLALARIWNRADEQLGPSPVMPSAIVFFHLLLRKMRQQVGDDEARLIRLSADADIHDSAVLEHGNAVQLEWDSDPLIFLYTAVIVCGNSLKSSSVSYIGFA